MCSQSANSTPIKSDPFDHLYLYSSASSTDHNNIYSYNFNNAESSTDSLTQQYNVSDLNFKEFLKDDDDLYEDDEGEIEYERGLAMYNPVTEDNVTNINKGIQVEIPQQQQPQTHDLEQELFVPLLLIEQGAYQEVTEVTQEGAQLLEEELVVVEEEGVQVVDKIEKPASNKRKLEDDLAASTSTSTSTSVPTNKKKKKNQAVFPCPLCSQISKTKYNMETHLLTHDKVKPYHCKPCDRWFSRKYDLTRHKNTATHKRKTA